MKPHKNTKISHYDTGNPWDKKKPKKQETFVAMVHDAVIVEGNLHGYQKSMIGGLKDYYEKSLVGFYTWETPEYVELYTATALEPGVEVLPKSNDVQWVEGIQVVVKKKRIVKNPKTAMGHWTVLSADCPTHWAYQFVIRPTPKEAMRSRVESFLNEPMPEPEKSPLILSKEFEEQRRRDLYKEKLAAFIENEVESKLAPFEEEIHLLQQYHQAQNNRIAYLQERAELREKDVDALNEQIAQLQIYKARIETATAHVGDGSRHLRTED